MPGRIEALDQELKKLKEIVLRLAPLAQQEMLNYRTLETQHSQLTERNTALAQQNLDAEERIRKAIETADAIIQVAKNEEKVIKMNVAAVRARAESKYKELEAKLEKADRDVIKTKLKELEETVA